MTNYGAKTNSCSNSKFFKKLLQHYITCKYYDKKKMKEKEKNGRMPDAFLLDTIKMIELSIYNGIYM